MKPSARTKNQKENFRGHVVPFTWAVFTDDERHPLFDQVVIPNDQPTGQAPFLSRQMAWLMASAWRRLPSQRPAAERSRLARLRLEEFLRVAPAERQPN